MAGTIIDVIDLGDGGAPANGSYDFQLGVFNAATNGTRVSAWLTNSAVLVTNGLFALTLDFGAGDKLPGVLIKYKFANELNEISINNHRFKLRGKATRLEFGDKIGAFSSTGGASTADLRNASRNGFVKWIMT